MSIYKRHETWSSSFTFLLAAIGAAVGLGNIWKFPYIMGANGGSAFVLVYLLVIAFVAIPILIAGWAMSYMFKTGGEVFEGQDAAAVRAEFDALLASPAQMSFWHALGFTGRFAEAGFFELLDYITANLMMPMGGLLLALFVGWRVAPRAVADEVNMQSPRLFRVWFWLLRWVVPVSISLIFISNL